MLTNVETGEAVDMNDPAALNFGPKGTGAADAKRVWAFCLEGGVYSITAFDELGEGSF